MRSGEWQRRGRIAAGLVAAALVAGCTNAGDLKQVSLSLPTEAALKSAVPKASERENARILATYGGAYENPKLQALIEKTVARLVAASERPDLIYNVVVLNSPAINAFALPNGTIYLTRGLITLANDEAELASVLAHEMGHVIARHAAIREEQARQAAVVAHVVTDVLDDPAAGALALAKSKLTLANFSRGQELEADGIGVGISARAGFDPYGAARILTDMQRNAEFKAGKSGSDPRALELFSSHPATPERIKNALENAKQYKSAGERDSDAYLDALDGAVYGEDPSEGLVRGRRFVHGKLGFTFTAPPGFTLDNTAQAVLGLRDGGNEALRLDVVSVPPEQTLGTYLTSGWIDNVDRATVEELSINGFPAATAMASGDSWTFRLYVVRYGSDVYRFIFAAKQRSIESDTAFREAVQSFRRMTVDEAAKVQPLHLTVRTVRPGDTQEKLARRMAVGERALETFRVLNGLAPGDALVPGRKVKLVVD
jgi:predicted Zn-dependent protease